MNCQRRTPAENSKPTEAHSPQKLGAEGIGATVRVSSQTLFSGANEIEIEHKGALYRLRQTSLGKLILTK